MLYRILLFAINIFFPPLSVLLVTGPYTDTLVNCLLFLCGVIPSHIHGFYVNGTYFHRRRKVKKGKWPGGPKAFIFDRNVWYGGVSKEEADALLRRSGEPKRQSQGKSKRRRRRSQARVATGYNDYTMDPRGTSQTIPPDNHNQYPHYYSSHDAYASNAGRVDGKNHVGSSVTPNAINPINRNPQTSATGPAWPPHAPPHDGRHPHAYPAHPPAATATAAARQRPERRTILGEIRGP